jgi:hypothetical protein
MSNSGTFTARTLASAEAARVRAALRQPVAMWRQGNGRGAVTAAQPGGKPIGARIACRRDMRIALATCALIGCAYEPGSFRYPSKTFAGQRATVGCLDVSVERRADLALGPVLAYQFANRCDHVAVVDLGAAVVVGRNAQGTDIPLRPYDPRSELHPTALDGRNIGAEALAYPADRAMPQLCVDAATLVHEARPQWLCFGAPAGPVVGRAR